MIQRDGSPVARVAWGTAMPVDPGEHRIEASAPGRVAWSAEVTVGPDADRQTITVPALEAAPAPERPPPAPVPAPVIVAPPPVPKPSPPLEPVETATLDYRAMLISGIVMRGVGVAGIGIGIGFGLDAINKKRASDDACVGGCTEEGAQKSSDAVRSADTSTAMLVLGGVLAAGGTALIVWSTLGEESAVSVALHPSGARLRASW